MWGIMNEEFYVDLGEFIFQGIQKFLRGNTQYSIPYASIVTRLCQAVGVTWPSHEQLQMPAAPIDSSNIEGMKEWTRGVPESHGLGYNFPGGQPAAEATMARASQLSRDAGPSRGPGGDSSGMADVHYRCLTRRMDAMHESQGRFVHELTLVLGTALRGLGVDIQ